MGNNLYYRRPNADLDFDYGITSVVTTGDLITLDDVKNYIRIDNNDDDDLLGNMRTQAERTLENYLNRDIRSKQRTVFYPQLDREIELFFAPIDTSVDIAITSDGNTLETSAYEVLGGEDPIIRLNTFPQQNIEISYTTQALDPSLARQCLLALIWNMHPSTAKDPQPWKMWAAPYRKLFI